LPIYRWNVARCLEELGQAEKAIQAFEHYLKLKDKPESQAQARERIRLLEERYLGQLQISCNLEGVKLQIKRLVHSHPCPGEWRRVRAGQYHVEARSPEGIKLSQGLEIRAGRLHKIRLAFPGRLKIRSATEGARVLIDRQFVGKTPYLGEQPPGHYIVTLQSDQAEWSKEVQVLAGKEVSVEAILIDQGGGQVSVSDQLKEDGILPWLTLGGSALSLGLGGFFAYRASQGFKEMETAGSRYALAQEEAEALKERRAIEQYRDEARQDRLIAWSGLGLGLLLGSGSLWALLSADEFVQPEPLSTPGRSSFNPSSLEGGAGLSWSLRW